MNLVQNKKITFPNLNGIRAIAALMVTISHVEFTMRELNHHSYWTLAGLGLLGDLGVTLFFTLSGFLITYLLLSEKQETTTVSIRKFYFRRILRIWPVYYLTVILGLFILPYIPFFQMSETVNIHLAFLKKLGLYVFMLPNLAFYIFGRIPYLVQTWSIGVEEQFYLIWPWVIARLKKPLFFLITVYILFLSYDLYAGVNHLHSSKLCNLGCLSIGAIGALLIFKKVNFFLKMVHSHYTFLISLVGIILMFFFNLYPFQLYEFYALFFIIVIVYLATAPVTIFNLNFGWLNYLGKISYGIYMYNFIPILIVIRLFESLNWINDSALTHLLIALFSTIGTILISSISYKYFENRFLRKKVQFEVISSGS